jgi:hypothetical protein
LAAHPPRLSPGDSGSAPACAPRCESSCLLADHVSLRVRSAAPMLSTSTRSRRRGRSRWCGLPRAT